MTPGAVFDCMVFVQALASAKGPACASYELVRQGKLTLFVSPEVIAEARDVLGRSKLRRKLSPNLTILDPPALLREFARRQASEHEPAEDRSKGGTADGSRPAAGSEP